MKIVKISGSHNSYTNTYSIDWETDVEASRYNSVVLNNEEAYMDLLNKLINNQLSIEND